MENILHFSFPLITFGSQSNINDMTTFAEQTTTINQFGEKVTKWENHKHPDSSDFMQLVIWTMWEKPDGSISVCYKLDFNGKPKFLYGLSKEEIFSKYGN